MGPIDVIAVDGEAASGKSVCAMLARRLGYELLETGVLYRAATMIVLAGGINPENRDAIESFVGGQKYLFGISNGQVTFRGRPIIENTNSTEIDLAAPQVARCLGVRLAITSIQHKFVNGKKVVVEGRDIGSVVFPNAKVKFFLAANLDVRAKRRHAQYFEKDPNLCPTLSDVVDQLSRRDHDDSTREHSPSVCTSDHFAINTSEMRLDEVVESMLSVISVHGFKEAAIPC